jgi:hypothetical protein
VLRDLAASITAQKFRPAANIMSFMLYCNSKSGDFKMAKTAKRSRPSLQQSAYRAALLRGRCEALRRIENKILSLAEEAGFTDHAFRKTNTYAGESLRDGVYSMIEAVFAHRRGKKLRPRAVGLKTGMRPPARMPRRKTLGSPELRLQ